MVLLHSPRSLALRWLRPSARVPRLLRTTMRCASAAPPRRRDQTRRRAPPRGRCWTRRASWRRSARCCAAWGWPTRTHSSRQAVQMQPLATRRGRRASGATRLFAACCSRWEVAKETREVAGDPPLPPTHIQLVVLGQRHSSHLAIVLGQRHSSLWHALRRVALRNKLGQKRVQCLLTKLVAAVPAFETIGSTRREFCFSRPAHNN